MPIANRPLRSSWPSIVRLVIAGLMILVAATAPADDWPQWRGPMRDGVWRETGIIERFDSPELQIKWRVPIGSGYSGPTVAGRNCRN